MKKLLLLYFLLFLLVIKSSCGIDYTFLKPESAYTMDDTSKAMTDLELIMHRYLAETYKRGAREIGLEFAFNFSMSAEGASFSIVRDESGYIRYLGVDIFGEMGRISHSYTFAEYIIVYNVVKVMYDEPFFVNPTNIPINSVSNSRYIIFGGRVYRYVDKGETLNVDDESAELVIETLKEFLEMITN